MSEKSHKKLSLLFPVFFIPLFISLLILLVFLFEKGMNLDFSNAGIFPRKPESIWTVFTSVFVHANLGHLFNNLLSFTVLSCFLFYFYRPTHIKIFIFLWLISGLLLWIIGRESRHIGASGLIYALAGFLFFSGIFRKHIPLISISLIVTLFYGNMVWHIFPWQVNDPVSWEGHLSGLATGLIAAVLFKSSGPQRPVKIWEEEVETDEEPYWEVNQSDSENNSEPTNKTIE